MIFLPLIAFLLTWAWAFFSPYQFDDYLTPVQDPASQSLAAWWSHLTTTLRPLTKLTYALESSLGAHEAFARRFFQYFLAIACAYLLAAFLERLTKNRILSYLLASVWVVLPLHSETFISLAGRSSLLAMVFILLSLLAEKRYLRIGFALLAVLSKETAILFFFFQFFSISKKTAVRVAGGLAMIAVLFRDHFIKLLNYSWHEVPYIVPWWEGPAAISAGLTTLLRPFSVSLELEFPWMVSALWFFVTLALLSVIAVQIYKKRGTRSELIWALGLWLVLILPTQSLIPKLDPLSLRALSFSSLAYPMIFAAIWGISTRANRVTYSILAGLLLIYGVAGYSLAKKYKDPVYLWQDASTKAPHKARPLVNLSYFLTREGKLHEAKDALVLAKARAPFDLEIDQRLRAVEVLLETEQLLHEGKSDER